MLSRKANIIRVSPSTEFVGKERPKGLQKPAPKRPNVDAPPIKITPEGVVIEKEFEIEEPVDMELKRGFKNIGRGIARSKVGRTVAGGAVLAVTGNPVLAAGTSKGLKQVSKNSRKRRGSLGDKLQSLTENTRNAANGKLSNLSGNVAFGKAQNTALVPIVLAVAFGLLIVRLVAGGFLAGRPQRRKRR